MATIYMNQESSTTREYHWNVLQNTIFYIKSTKPIRWLFYDPYIIKYSMAQYKAWVQNLAILGVIENILEANPHHSGSRGRPSWTFSRPPHSSQTFYFQNYGWKWLVKIWKGDPVTDIYHIVNGNVKCVPFEPKRPHQAAILAIFTASPHLYFQNYGQKLLVNIWKIKLWSCHYIYYVATGNVREESFWPPTLGGHLGSFHGKSRHFFGQDCGQNIISKQF